ncbi:MAG: HD domain-containing protein [bacterium]|nr:HD domain-containing protein [bacterium]
MKCFEIPAAFLAYYRTFEHDEMHDLKYAHTCRVVQNATRIMEGEGFSSRLRELGLMAAWLHDLGRFHQFQKYRTFSDAVSINHALLSCCEALRLEWLEDWSAADRHLILRAIEFHNLRDLPSGLSEDEVCLCHLVRDADKLDIYTVLDHAIETHYLPTHPEVYWGLPFAAAPSPKVVAALQAGESIDYKEIKSFADFVFIQLAWCNGGLHFATASQLTLDRQEVQVREHYLCEIVPEHAAVVHACCRVATEALQRHALKIK